MQDSGLVSRQVIVMDRHAEGPLDALWSAVAAGAGPTALTTPISSGHPCTPPCIPPCTPPCTPQCITPCTPPGIPLCNLVVLKCVVPASEAGAQYGCLAHMTVLYAVSHAVGLHRLQKPVSICKQEYLIVRAEAYDIGNPSW